jgi:hypothetical protein
MWTRRRILRSGAFSALTAAATSLAGEAEAAEPKRAASKNKTSLGILVPAYFDPNVNGGQYWDRLIDAAASVPIIAIANPASGPGKMVDPAYTPVLERARKAGVRVVGYVSTSYTKRPRPEILADIARWVEFYPKISGFFFDEQTSDPAHVGDYVAYRDAARKLLKNARIVTNPGVPCDEGYLSRKATDIACIFEHHTGFNEFLPPAWTKKHPARSFASLPYATPDEATMRQRLKKSVADGIGWVYITDDTGSNPWDRLPTYWEAEVDAVRAINDAG